MTNRPEDQLFVDVDVAAASVTTTWRGRTTDPVKPVTLPQTPDGYRQFQAHLGATGIAPTETLVI